MHNLAILSYMKSLSLSRPRVIIMAGIPGSGKTFFAEQFAITFHAPYIHRDKVVELLGKDDKRIEDIINYQLTELVKTKQSIIIETNVQSRAERGELMRKVRQAGYESLLVWVQTDPQTAKNRYKKANSGRDDYEKLLKRFIPPIAVEKPVVISGKHTYATQARILLKKLSEPRVEIATHATPPIRTTPNVEAAPRRRNITIT